MFIIKLKINFVLVNNLAIKRQNSKIMKNKKNEGSNLYKNYHEHNPHKDQSKVKI
jgi:hypothetical protein